ncbi:MAG TPA: hypothetical protein VM925_18860 [Labilithrix sp.]|nr:hypothetical protein [Labilithrix sp.]
MTVHEMITTSRILVLAAAMAGSLVPAEARADETPQEHSGFQFALRSGVAIPFGSVSTRTAMSDALSVQVPLIADIGWKPIPQLFIGGFLGAAVGGAAGQIEASCDRLGLNCVGLGLRAGALVELSFRPGAATNPWIGYGIGYEYGQSSGSSGSRSISNTVRGFEFAHILGGVDFRLQKYFGIGPFIDAALGKYDVAESETNYGGLVATRGGGQINEQAFHVWLILGVRVVMLP